MLVSITALLAFVLTTLLLFTLAVVVASRLRRREQEATALHEAARVITSTLEVPDVLSHLLANCAQTLNATAGIVRLLSVDGSTLEFAAEYGLSENYVGKGAIHLDQSPIDRQATRGEIVIIADTRRETRFMYKDDVLSSTSVRDCRADPEHRRSCAWRAACIQSHTGALQQRRYSICVRHHRPGRDRPI